jgi:hypothetical protein
MAEVDDQRTCPSCHAQMEQDWLPRLGRDAQWNDHTSVMIHVDPKTGDIRYPGNHDAKLKPGYERQYLRSLREVERFEREHNVRSEMAWFDKGSGRGHDDEYRGKRMTH